MVSKDNNSSAVAVFKTLLDRNSGNLLILSRKSMAMSCGLFLEKKSKLKYYADTVYQKLVAVNAL